VTDRPNILIFCTDEQRGDHLGCMGHPHLKTPSIDRIAAEGTLFRIYWDWPDRREGTMYKHFPDNYYGLQTVELANGHVNYVYGDPKQGPQNGPAVINPRGPVRQAGRGHASSEPGRQRRGNRIRAARQGQSCSRR